LGKDRLEYWLALSMLRGMERLSVVTLLERFNGPEEIFSSDEKALEGFSVPFARSVRAFDAWDRVEKERELAHKDGARIVTFEDSEYPSALKRIYDPPCLLYMKGAQYRDGFPAVGVVGTRHPTHYGLKMAETLGTELGYMGATVVSGMARGCDTAAHKGALSAGGATVAVLGTGVDIVYPGESRKLYDEIAEKGLLITEYLMSTPPLPHNFPRRNRIISGLSMGVVVVEAPLRSGSLMTARLALEQGREVFAVPGQVTSYRSTGTNKLIKDGAMLVESASDVAAALSISPLTQGRQASELKAGAEEMMILDALEEGPAQIDSLIDRTGLTVARTSTLLLEMELKGFVEQKPGKCFMRRV